MKGLLRLLSSQCPDHVRSLEYDPSTLTESHTLLQNRRRKKHTTLPLWSQECSFQEYANRHRYVCFFVVQGHSSNYFSNHCLQLRKRLAEDYHDVMTTFLMNIGDKNSSCDDTIFCHGTGFAAIPATPLLLSMLNVNQVPTIIILDNATGQKISRDAMIAMEWNDAHSVINAWQKGKSGLSFAQKTIAVATLQSDCIIL